MLRMLQTPPRMMLFDPLIIELHKFEEIRYLDLLAAEGGSFTIGLGSRPPGTPRELTPKVTRYRLYLGEDRRVSGRAVLSGYIFREFSL